MNIIRINLAQQLRMENKTVIQQAFRKRSKPLLKTDSLKFYNGF